MRAQLKTFHFSCKECGRQTELVTIELPDDVVVVCSQCQQPLGAWGDVRPHDNDHVEVLQA